MSAKSLIYSYDKHTKMRTDIHLNSDYLGGSHDLNWDGIIIEKLYTIGGTSNEIYFKDYIFVIALDDVNFDINNETIETLKNDVFISPRKSSYKLNIDESFTGIMMSISQDFIKDHFHNKNIGSTKFIKNYRIVDSNLNSLINLIYNQAQSKTNFNDVYLALLLTTFVTYFVNNYSNYQTPENEHILNGSCITKIDQYIDKNFANEITYKDIASLSGMSNYSFLTEFKDLTSYTPHQYILKRKLKRAKQLLLNSLLTVTEISHDLGFTDSSHFSKFFKKQTKMSPSHFRSQQSSK